MLCWVFRLSTSEYFILTLPAEAPDATVLVVVDTMLYLRLRTGEDCSASP